MDVQIISTQTIKPSSPTPRHLHNFKPSFLDQTSPPFYIPLTLFYRTRVDPEARPDLHSRLKSSLSRTLSQFYPLAGRIQNMFNVSCNDEGVLYTEAKVNFALSQFLENPDLNLLNKFLPAGTNSMENGPRFQVAVQVSFFSCGGFVIGVCFFHWLVDVTTMAKFLKTWAGICGGPTSDKKTNHRDFVDLQLGSSLFPPVTSFPADFHGNKTRYFFSDGRDYNLSRRFVFSPSAIAALREKSASAAVPRPSRVEAITGFVSERLVSGLGESAVVTHSVNIRRRIDPPLPETAFGNFIWYASAIYGPPEEGDGIGLPDYVAAMREALGGIQDDVVRSLEPESAVGVLSENFGMLVEAGIRAYKFSSWLHTGFYDLDFGWGRPIWVAHMGDAGPNRTKNQLMFLEGRNRGEIELWVLFGEDEMGILENDEEFLAFATPNPSILVKK